MYLFEKDRCILLSGNQNFKYHESCESIGDQIRRYPLHPSQIHLWELEIPEELCIIGGCRAGPVDEMKLGTPWDAARFFPKVVLHRLRSYILASYLSCNPGEVRLSYGKYGQPIVDTPSCPYTFSTSYSGKNWMLAISHENLVGVDIEQIKEIPDLISIAHRLFHTEELNLIISLPPIEQTQAFFNLWTLKEAYLKATGKGWSGWESLPNMTHCISGSPAGPHWTCHRIGEYRAFLMTSSMICRAIVSCPRH